MRTKQDNPFRRIAFHDTINDSLNCVQHRNNPMPLYKPDERACISYILNRGAFQQRTRYRLGRFTVESDPGKAREPK
jgi:hypothetical protein